MTVTTTPQVRSTHDEWRDRRWRLTGAVIALFALGTAALMVTTGLPSTTDHGFTFMGWGVPWHVVLLGTASWLAVLLLIVGGPEPWRATRWAWGWAWLLTGPLGSVAYLLLGGPTGFLRPHHGHRRLTGGWAFLLAWVLFAGWRETNGG
jgi:hypothetical protein